MPYRLEGTGAKRTLESDDVSPEAKYTVARLVLESLATEGIEGERVNQALDLIARETNLPKTPAREWLNERRAERGLGPAKIYRCDHCGEWFASPGVRNGHQGTCDER